MSDGVVWFIWGLIVFALWIWGFWFVLIGRHPPDRSGRQREPGPDEPIPGDPRRHVVCIYKSECTRFPRCADRCGFFGDA